LGKQLKNLEGGKKGGVTKRWWVIPRCGNRERSYEPSKGLLPGLNSTKGRHKPRFIEKKTGADSFLAMVTIKEERDILPGWKRDCRGRSREKGTRLLKRKREKDPREGSGWGLERRNLITRLVSRKKGGGGRWVRRE